MDRKKRVLREEEQRLLQIDIDLASTTANLKDQEIALASLQEDHGVEMCIRDRLKISLHN